MELSYRTKRRLKWLGGFLILLLILGVFHRSILRGMGEYLYSEDPKVHAQAMVVLGGASFERGLEGVKLFKEGLADQVLCTGGNVPTILPAMDTTAYEAEITEQFMIRRGVDANAITALTSSTSTLEESQEVLKWCTENKVTSLTVVSSWFHLRRVRRVFEKTFAESEVKLHFRGSLPVDYKAEEWWKAEQGLVTVFNEYVKLGYYILKY